MNEELWYANLIEEWDFEKNAKHISEYSYGSSKIVWWICLEYKHSYSSMVKHKTLRQYNCPYCSGRKILQGFNDLETLHPDLANEVSEASELKPYEVSSMSNKILIWQCDKNHEYKATVKDRQNGSKCCYCSGEKLLEGFNDLKTKYPKIAQQVSKNHEITSNKILYSTKNIILWECGLGHEWSERISKNFKEKNCPYCANLKFLKGFNDLATVYPELAKEFDEDKNGISASEYFPRNFDQAWWKCSNNHSYRTEFNTKIMNKGCAICSNKKVQVGFNDLSTTHPHIASEWDYSKNTLTPDNIVSGSTIKVWWLCILGHSYNSQIRKRTNYKRGCPYCANQKVLEGFNDLFSQRKDIISEWDYNKNTVKPSTVAKRTKTKFWWRCKENNHSWQAAPDTRSHGEKCPYCTGRKTLKGFNDLLTTNPELEKEWNTRNNKDISEFSYGSQYKAWWICDLGHEWQAAIYSRTGKKPRGCSKCAFKNKSSKAEQEILEYLSKISSHEIKCNDRDIIAPKEIDIYIPDKNIAIEFNGLYWHSEKSGKTKNYHQDKWKQCQDKNIQLITIWEYNWTTDSQKNKIKASISEILSPTKPRILEPYSIRELKIEDIENFQKRTGEKLNISLKNYNMGLFFDNNLMSFFSIKEDNGFQLEQFYYDSYMFDSFSKILDSINLIFPQVETLDIVAEKDSFMNFLCLDNDFKAEKELEPDFKIFYKSKVWDQNSFLRKHKDIDTVDINKIWQCSRTMYKKNL